MFSARNGVLVDACHFVSVCQPVCCIVLTSLDSSGQGCSSYVQLSHLKLKDILADIVQIQVWQKYKARPNGVKLPTDEGSETPFAASHTGVGARSSNEVSD
jgi:hypothetical protein